MSTRTINAWIMACVLAILLSSTWRLDDNGHEMQESADLQDAIKTEAADARFARASAEICGENAAALDLGDGSIQCLTKRGHKTRRVAL